MVRQWLRLASICAPLALAAACAGAHLVPSPGAAAAAVPLVRSAQNETPLMADAFVDSIGVNTHLPSYLQNDGRYRLVIGRMKELGVRHVRDDIYQLDARQYRYARAFLVQTNSRMEAIVDCPQPLGYQPGSATPPKVIRAFDAGIGGRMELLEGPNEPDIRHVKGWGLLTIACIKPLDHLYSSPFVAPAMAYGYHAPKLGNISQLVGLGAIHRYFSGFNPGNDGFGITNACGTFGQLSWSICEARVNSGPQHPIFVTETGYSTPGEIDETTDGAYISRVLLVDSAGGIPRTYLYDLYDDGTDAKNWEDGYGLLRYDGSRKPAFFAVRSLVGALSDPGPAFTPSPLRYALYAARTVDHELFQKRNGRYVLALWNEVESWNPATNREIHVPARPVSVVLPRAPTNVAAQSLTPGGLPAAQHPVVNGNRIVVDVDDRVTLLSFR